jgi:glycosyltransferase involved in cell wall biosynthesis
MRVMVFRAGEPVPGPDRPVRWSRSGLISKALAARGHQVTWVVATFDHGAKHHVFPQDTTWTPLRGIEMVALYAPGYSTHRSPRRLLHHHVLARKLRQLMAQSGGFDLLVPALPVPEVARDCVRQAKAWGVPCVVDCRDMWPDIFREGRHGLAALAVRAATAPMERATREACAGATAILGHTEEFVEWGVAKAGRARRPDDRAFAFGYTPDAPTGPQVSAARALLDRAGVMAERQVLRVTFVGTLTRHFDLEIVLGAFADFARRNVAVELVICGDGDRGGQLRETGKGLPNVRWLGWQEAPVIWELLRRSDVGLAPHIPSPSFVQSVPNKIIEYLSAGTPILTSLAGTTADLLAEHRAGWTYPSGDRAGVGAAIERLVADRDGVRRAGEAGQALFESRFRADQVYGGYAEHLEGIVANFRR